jgi:hypothetical protein
MQNILEYPPEFLLGDDALKHSIMRKPANLQGSDGADSILVASSLSIRAPWFCSYSVLESLIERQPIYCYSPSRRGVENARPVDRVFPTSARLDMLTLL